MKRILALALVLFTLTGLRRCWEYCPADRLSGRGYEVFVG